MTTYTITANGSEMGTYAGATAAEAFLAAIDAAEIEAECADCGREVGEGEVPATDDGEGWAAAAEGHAADCAWVATRAHRIAASTADCENLGELLAFLNTLDGEELERRGVDLAGLPTFGGEAPADTQGVWSWDAHSLLVSGPGMKGCAGPAYKIVSREDWAARDE